MSMERKTRTADSVRVELVLTAATGDTVADVGVNVNVLVFASGQHAETVHVDKNWLTAWLATQPTLPNALAVAQLMIALRDEAASKLLNP